VNLAAMPRLIHRLTGVIRPPTFASPHLRLVPHPRPHLTPLVFATASATPDTAIDAHPRRYSRPSTFLYPSFLHSQPPPRLTPPTPLPHLTPRPSTSPHRHQQMQVRFTVRGTEYQPSQRKRKRRHGFLARLRSVGGRKILKRRALKGRKNMSH